MNPSQTKESLEHARKMRSPENMAAGAKRRWRQMTPAQKTHLVAPANAARLKCPDMQATAECFSARTWSLYDPSGKLWQFRNLKLFIREHVELFAAEDIQWKLPTTGKLAGAWCRASSGLTRLRPEIKNKIHEWKGWKWAKDVQEMTEPIKPLGMMSVYTRRKYIVRLTQEFWNQGTSAGKA